MSILNPIKLFGSRRRTEVLALIYLLGETYASELASMLGTPVKTIQRITDALEQEDMIVGRVVGVERRLHLNPRYPLADPLSTLLAALCSQDREIEAIAERIRRRPRKRGKAL
jgi:hypothetical protein